MNTINDLPEADQVMSFQEWCRLNSISEATGRRILASSNAPDVVRLSARRIGITVGANRAWRAPRTLTASAA